MRPLTLLAASAVAITLGVVHGQPQRDRNPPGTRLEDLTWVQAEALLDAESVVVLPLGAAAKEHGPHLRLRNDLTLAEYLARRVTTASEVVLAPPIVYHFYPAFLEYPGSTSLSLNAARDMTADIVRSLAGHGPRRFYVLNTGLSTLVPLRAAAQALGSEGILLRYTDLEARLDGAVRAVQQQAGGSHADEIETSMMLYVDPAAVDMSKAVKDYAPRSGPVPFTRTPGGRGTYSPTGVWGDATLATREKGRVLVEALVAGILADIEDLRRATPPQAAPPAPAAPPPPSGTQRGAGAARRTAGDCTGGDDRIIRAIGAGMTLAWTNQDAVRLSLFWSEEGDIVHPDGQSERSRDIIRHNRALLFARTEYKSSRHSLAIGEIRCLSNDVAVADGKWELRGVMDARRQALPAIQGLATLVLKRAAGAWLIEAYRYTMDPPLAGSPPVVLPRPGGPPPRGR